MNIAHTIRMCTCRSAAAAVMAIHFYFTSSSFNQERKKTAHRKFHHNEVELNSLWQFSLLWIGCTTAIAWCVRATAQRAINNAWSSAVYLLHVLATVFTMHFHQSSALRDALYAHMTNNSRETPNHKSPDNFKITIDKITVLMASMKLLLEPVVGILKIVVEKIERMFWRNLYIEIRCEIQKRGILGSHAREVGQSITNNRILLKHGD